MPTTTNYSWTTPADTDLVKDGAAAIRSLGTSIDTTTKNLNPSTTLGDIEYRSSTANVNTRVGIGTTGQILTVAGGVPTWATPGAASPASAQSFVTTKQTTSSTTYTGLSTAQAVTLTTGTKVMVCLTLKMEPNSTNQNYMSYAISGATTKAAANSKSVCFTPWATVASAPEENTWSAVYFETVTAGSNTFTAQFRVSGGTGYFLDRQLLVIDLGS